MPKMCSAEYLEKVKQLSDEESERLLSRMAGSLPKRLAKHKLSQTEALALQMEIEDEHLQEWRKMRLELKNRDEEEKKKVKSKEEKGKDGKAEGKKKS